MSSLVLASDVWASLRILGKTSIWTVVGDSRHRLRHGEKVRYGPIKKYVFPSDRNKVAISDDKHDEETISHLGYHPST